MAVSIDVVIPSYRVDEKNLLPVLTLSVPAFAQVIFYLVVDNPYAVIPDAIQGLADNRKLFLLMNEKNSGASYTRNRGMEAGTGDWILFLDDDLMVPEDLIQQYALAAQANPGETGFIGLVKLPEPETDFSKAISISGSMDIFTVAERKPSFVWGATANFMIRRSALHGERFSLVYPKSGGGEDIDLFLRIREKNQFRNYKSLPEARVYHPWWNDGNPDFKKPFRYGRGNSWLGELNPRYTYRDFLNTPEILFLSVLLMLVSIIIRPVFVLPLLAFMMGAVIIEVIASAVQTIKRSHSFEPRIIGWVLALRFIYECGLLWGNLSRFRLAGIGERFHDDGKQDKFFFYRTNTHRIIKWILYPLWIYALIRLFT